MKRIQTVMLALGVLFGAWGKGNGVEVGEWAVVKEFGASEKFTPLTIFPISDGDVWVAGYEFETVRLGGFTVTKEGSEKSAIYRFQSGEWKKEVGVPNIGQLVDLAMASPTKGWAMGDGRLLEYDGVFWQEVPNIPADGSFSSRRSISIVNENEVWFANQYRSINGRYEKFTFPDYEYIVEIRMRDGQNGYALTSSSPEATYEADLFHYNGASWSRYYQGISTSFDNNRFPKGFVSRGDSGVVFDYNAEGGGAIIRAIEGSGQDIVPVIELSEFVVSLFGRGILWPSTLVDPEQAVVLEIDKDDQVWFSVDSNEGPFVGDEVPYIGSVDNNNHVSVRQTPVKVVNLRFTSTSGWGFSSDGTIIRGAFVLPALQRSASRIGFDDVHFSQLPQVNTQTRRNLILSNTGKGTLQVSSIASDNQVFRVQPTSGTIAPGDSLQVAVVYFPTTAGQHTGRLTIQSNDPTSPSLQIELIGATLGSIQPKISASSSLNFTSTPTNATITRDLTIQNTGNARLSISSISSNSAVFRANADSLSIGPGSSRNIAVSFAPTAEDQTSARLTILSDDPATPSLQVSLRGIGELPPPPQPTANTGNLSVKPGNPSTADQVTLSLAGNFPTASAAISTQTHTISGSTISVDLTTAWSGDPRNTTVTQWKIDEVVGQLSAGAYTVVANVNGTRFYSSSLTVLEGPPPEGPISFDFNLAAGDQKQRTAGSATADKTYQLQLNVAGAPEINGWSVTIEYDPRQVRYVSDSFQASSFISGLLALVDEKEGSVGVGGTVLGSSGKNSGDGTVGTLSFEVLEGIKDSTDLTITEVTFRRLDGVEDKQAVRSVATIKKAAVAGALAGDFDGNGKVAFDDFFLFADAFGSANPGFDLSGNGTVDFDDFFLFADNFGKEAQAKLIALAREYIGLPATALEQSYPNPFNSSTTLRYQLAEAGQVHLEVYDVSGQKVRSLVGVQQTPGIYSITWDGTNEQDMEVSTGIYFARLQVGEYAQVNKMMLMK